MEKTIHESQRPNILWISMEDTSPRFGCYGDYLARTPNIDRLAIEGRRYPNAFSTAGVCAPSRSAIITGMYQTSIGTHHMSTSYTNPSVPDMPTPYSAVLPPHVKTFTEYLRASGYYCTNNEKTHYQFDVPFTAWDECGSHAHWRNRESGQPFFSVFNPTVTHESGMWPNEDKPLITDPRQLQLPPYIPDTPMIREALARHYDNIAESDRRIGGILGQLEEDGLADNTVVFLWSDHGEGLPRAKRWLYDAGIRIPLIVRWPGQLESGVAEDLISLVDLAPTVLSLAGVEIPFHMQGSPFLGPNVQPREYVFAARDRHDAAYDRVRAVRDKRYKYIRNYYPEKPYQLWIPYLNRHPIMKEMWRLYAKGQLEGVQQILFRSCRPVEELYDCENDPFEIHNLADDSSHRSTLERMRLSLDEWRSRFGDMGDIAEDVMVAQMWRGNTQPRTIAPVIVPIDDLHPGVDIFLDGDVFMEPLLIQLHCATQGASIGYTMDTGDQPQWKLYTEPFFLSPGTTVLRTKAIRIGYQESPENEATFVVNPSQ